MDWKQKYLKYKIKYIQLKKQQNQILFSNKYKNNGGNVNGNENVNVNENENENENVNENDDVTKQDVLIPNINNNHEYWKLLKKLYPNCVKKPNESNGQTETYGEMEYVGIEKLCLTINPSNTIKYFLDIGSGRAKLPCWFAGVPNIIKSIGIEIVSQRHVDGVELVEKLNEKFPQITNKINLLEGSFELYDLGLLTAHSSNTLVWISNLCFGEELTDKIFTQILSQMAPGTIICCSKKPSEKFFQSAKLKLSMIPNTNPIQIQMSWWDNLSDVYVCEIA